MLSCYQSCRGLTLPVEFAQHLTGGPVDRVAIDLPQIQGECRASGDKDSAGWFGLPDQPAFATIRWTRHREKRHGDERDTLGGARLSTNAEQTSGRRNMCNQTPSTNNEFSDPSTRKRITTDDLRRAAERCRDLDDSALMAQAWDEPALTRPGLRTFGQLPNIDVPEDFDGPLSGGEVAAWEGDSAE